MIKKIKRYLETNPREKENTLPKELMKMGINLYHILSLLWDATTRKYTNEYVIYLAQELLEMFVNDLPEQANLDDMEERMEEVEKIFEEANLNEIIELFGIEIDNCPENKYGLSIDLKIGAVLRALNCKGISNYQIFEKYQ